ncbi:GTPase HflX [Nicoliella spurrieriana]|uniref:GTPase HflX n=1 Tax=Nicoliella spurrieriana TaxID=2925830 RepID=A0A976RR15_9LACO|nr:GTPase HflX [Nicoliella spurrieriana]UQS86307.1 GTPase HflX [Nicoliella spurrieriana]
MNEEQALTPVITAGLNIKDDHFDYSMAELNNLATANQMTVVESLVQKTDHRDAATYFGKGKVEELATILADDGVETVIINDELSPSQIRNLEKRTKAKIIDRTGLILEIFANRARTHEARLQVELAKLQYQLPRLHTSASQRLDQQTGAGGGGFTSRGAGESQYELNRRVIQNRISHIKHELKQIKKSDQTQRKQRDANQIPTIALVGYTNAGKSTIMNQLLARFGDQDKQVMVKNMLFATLDTSVRRLVFKDHKQLLISDTVGFVSKLPHQLVSAFRSTLAEAASADLLVQVVDFSDSDRQLMMDTTQSTLEEIGVPEIPMVTIMNKADLTDSRYPFREGQNLIMAANDEKSIDALVELIKENVFKNYVTKELLVPFSDGQVVSELNERATVLNTAYVDAGTQLTVELPASEVGRFETYIQD